jgi:dTDP-4-amino-4,6-dideoxygalactose transaminase
VEIVFNKPCLGGRESDYLNEVLGSPSLGGGGCFTRRAEVWLEENLGGGKAFLTTSCTAALEIGVMLAGVNAGDEVILPSFTISSAANAVVLRGGVPVFVDIRPDTLNIDPERIEAAVTSRTRAIMPMHYAGVGCDMTAIRDIAERHGLIVIEDAAHALLSRYKGKACGRLGDVGAISFHATKNIVSGEGGVLIINRPDLIERTEVIRDKGTDRGSFLRGETKSYKWLDIGSSYMPSELVAAFLLAQLEESDNLTDRRRNIWKCYHDALEECETKGLLSRPEVPAECEINGHIYYIILPDNHNRERVRNHLLAEGIHAHTHFVPLHNSPAGLRFGRTAGPMNVTDSVAGSILRLPIWAGIEAHLDSVIARVRRVIGS